MASSDVAYSSAGSSASACVSTAAARSNSPRSASTEPRFVRTNASPGASARARSKQVSRLGEVVRMLLADAAIDPKRRVGIRKQAQVFCAQGVRLRVAAQPAQQVRQIAQRLAMPGLGGERRAVRGHRALGLTGAFQRLAEIVEQAGVRARERERRFIGGDRLGVTPLFAMQVAEMEPRIGVSWIALQRRFECRLRGAGIAPAQHDAEQRPRRRVIGVERERGAAARFRERRIVALPGAAGLGEREPRRILVDRGRHAVAPVQRPLRNCAWTRSTTAAQSRGRGWRNRRAVGYQGLSSRSRSQRQSAP